jgi:hypothetical protein
VRSGLRKIYGGGAAEDPAFARVFRPLDVRLEFLSSGQQLRIQRARHEHERSARAASDAGAAGFMAGRSVAASVGGVPAHVSREHDVAWQEALASILDEQLLFEYALRESGLAEQLRNCGVAFTEREFRETYALLAELDEHSGAESYRRARRALHALLGTQRFDRLWASRDPVYAAVHELMRRRNYPEPTILAAYGVLNTSQDALAEIAVTSGRDPVRQMVAAREIGAREEKQLTEIVGAELARQILDARVRVLLEMSARPAPSR